MMLRRRRRPHETVRLDDVPVEEGSPAYEREDAAEVAARDSEVDFADEAEEEIPPLDVVEAAELGALLDDPELLDGEET
jgi:hypothetical protein